MANGDYIQNTSRTLEIKFLDAISTTALGVGVWRSVRELAQMTFHASALETGAVAQVMVSNAETLPANSTDGPVAALLEPTNLVASLNGGYRWAKVKKTEGGVPAATTVIMEANRVAY